MHGWRPAPAHRLVCGAGAGRQVRRGARRPDGSRVHLVGVLEHSSGTVLTQVEVASKGSEIGAFVTVLDRVDLHGCVVTADAPHTQSAHAHYLHRHGGHYVLTVKGNQPTLRARCAALPWAQVPVGHVEHDKGHGRREQRTVQVITVVQPRLPFPHARQVARVVLCTRSSYGRCAIASSRSTPARTPSCPR